MLGERVREGERERERERVREKDSQGFVMPPRCQRHDAVVG